MITDQLEEHLRSEFHRLDQRMAAEGNRDLAEYVAPAPAPSHRWVRVAAVVSVAAAVVLLIPILKPSSQPTTRVADAPVVLPGETRLEAVERITRACMIEGGFTSIDGVSGSPFDVAAYEPSSEMAARMAICVRRIEDLGLAEPEIVLPGESPFAAQVRITEACMLEGGIPSAGKISVSENNGPLIASVAFKDSPEMRVRQGICEERFLALGIDKPPTAEQWTAFYPHVVALVDCLSARGFDMGPIISLDEYVSGGGKTPVSPKLVALESADETDPKYRECAQKEVIPYVSILQT